MFATRFRNFVAALLAVCATWSVVPAQAQTTGKLALAHVAPDDGIVFITWNGWTEPDPKSTNRTERLLAEESLKDFIKQLGAEIDRTIEAAAGRAGGGPAVIVGQAVPYLVKTAITHPGAMFLTSFKPSPDNPDIQGAVVIDAQGDGAKAIESFKKLIDLAPKQGRDAAIEEKIGDATFYRPAEYPRDAPKFRVGYRGSQLLLTFGDETAKSLVAKLTKPGQPPAWVAQLLKDMPVDRPNALTHFNGQPLLAALQPIIAAEPMAVKVLEALGVNKLKSLSSVSGFDKTGMQIKSLIATDGTPSGIFDLIPDKPLSIADFKQIPASAVNATVTRFDLAYLYDRVLNGIGHVDPNVRQHIEGGLASVEPQLGFSVKSDVLEALGDTWTVYTSSIEPGAMFMPGFVITASVRKQANLAKALEIVVNAAKAAIAQGGPQVPVSIQDFTARGEKGYRVQINGIPIPVSPTWLLTEDQLIIGLTPQLVSGHLSATARGTMADNQYVKAAFAWNPKPVSVSYSDPKPGLQTIYTLVNTFGPFLTGQLAQQGINFNLPPLPPIADLDQHLLPTVTTFGRTANGWRTESHGVIPSGAEVGPAVIAVSVALLLPAVQQAREAARRAQSKNNMKQLGLAMHNYHDAHRAFPPAANADKKGKALLSWRVHILPYIDQLALYQQFHLDEPWDSEHNKQFIDKIPPTYIQPSHADLGKQGKTVYLVPTGKGTAFEGNEGLGVRTFTDGTSNTILAVEAHRDAAVIWTKPDDLVVDFKNPHKNLKSALRGGFHILMSDGTVRFVSDSINADVLKSLFTRNGNEVVGEF